MILIVDDYPDTAEMLVRSLKHRGYSATFALDASQAMETIRAFPTELPLLVVLDQMMPLMTGTQMLRQLRGEDGIARTAVVFFSASPEPKDRAEALELGARAWMSKGGWRSGAGGGDVNATLNEIIDHYHEIGGAQSQRAGA